MNPVATGVQAAPPTSASILACAWALGIGGTTMMPLLVTNSMARLGLDEGQATMLTGAEMIGMLAGCVILPALARRWPARLTAGALVLLVLCQSLSALTLPVAAFSVLRIVAGLCEAQMIVMVGICLACHPHAERLWGVVLLLSGLAAAGVFTLLSWFPGVAAGDALWIALALMAAVLGPVAARVPALMPVRGPAALSRLGGGADPAGGPNSVSHIGVSNGGSHSAVHGAARRDWSEIWLAWGVFIGVYSVQAGVWAVSALQGERIGLSLPTTGILLALSSLLGFFGAVVPAIPGLAGRRGATVIGALVVMFVSVAGFFTAHNAILFFVTQLALNAAFYTIMAVLNSFISARDHDGTLLSQSVVVTFAAVALGTIGAGELFQYAGGQGLILFSLLALAVSVPLGLKALHGRGAQLVS
jgi:hypothetical protein